MAFPVTRLRRLRQNDQLRTLVRETRLTPEAFVYPLFVCPGEGVSKEVKSMPGVFNLSVDEAVKTARETAALGVRFVGVDTRDNIDAARAFVRTFEIPYPSLIDDDGSLMLTFNGVIPVSAVPSTVVVDPAGHIAARVVGIISYGTLRGLVDDVLAEAPSTAQKGGS